MAAFPEIDTQSLTVEPEFNTLISQFDGGGEQRRSKQMYPKYNVTLSYEKLEVADARTLWEFYLARNGAQEAFYIYDFALFLEHKFNHKGQYCGTGDGTTKIFDIPGRTTTSHTIYSDGVDVTTSTSILVGGGNSDSDRVEYNTAPGEGVIITADFTGYLRIRARFAEDKLPRETFIEQIYSYGIKLKGLSPQ
ncbi:MAG: DUF2460 domain-containing protein [Deltaproteobacteria bacterium]|nr:DUF2460 domain-containing protein [Deltaproteobacteria bacterium]